MGNFLPTLNADDAGALAGVLMVYPFTGLLPDMLHGLLFPQGLWPCQFGRFGRKRTWWRENRNSWDFQRCVHYVTRGFTNDVPLVHSYHILLVAIWVPVFQLYMFVSHVLKFFCIFCCFFSQWNNRWRNYQLGVLGRGYHCRCALRHGGFSLLACQEKFCRLLGFGWLHPSMKIDI